MTTNNVIRNDGMSVLIDAELVLVINGREKHVTLKNQSIRIYPNHTVVLPAPYDNSDPMSEDQLNKAFSIGGMKFEEYVKEENAMPRKALRTTFTNASLIEMLTDKPNGTDGWFRQGNLVCFYAGGNGWLMKKQDIEKEILRRTNQARRWINQTFPGFLRRTKLSNERALLFFEKARHADVIRVNVGETTDVRWSGNSYFGSGGASGEFRIWGNVKKGEEVKPTDKGFVQGGTLRMTFTGPGAVYTEAGDLINGGRTFWREVHIADGNSIPREPEKVVAVEASEEPLLGE